MVIRRNTSLDINFDKEAPVINSVYFHKYSGRVCVVIDYDSYYGWFIVRFADGSTKKYGSLKSSNPFFRKATIEEYADYRLSQANRSIDDTWSDS